MCTSTVRSSTYIAAPDLIQQLASCVHPIGMSHEELEQTVFCGAKAEQGLIGGYPVANRIEPESPTSISVSQP